MPLLLSLLLLIFGHVSIHSQERKRFQFALAESKITFISNPPTLLRFQDNSIGISEHLKFFEELEQKDGAKHSNNAEMAYSHITNFIKNQIAENKAGIIIVGVKERDLNGESDWVAQKSANASDKAGVQAFEKYFESISRDNGSPAINRIKLLQELGLLIIEFDPAVGEEAVQHVLRKAWEENDKVWLIEADTQIQLRDKENIFSSNFYIENQLNRSLAQIPYGFSSLVPAENSLYQKLTEIVKQQLSTAIDSSFSRFMFNRFPPIPLSTFGSFSNNPFSQAMNTMLSVFNTFPEPRTNRPNDVHYRYQWALDNPYDSRIDINAPQAWELVKDASLPFQKVVVAHIDTGIDRNHPDLAQNIWRNVNEIPNNGMDDDGNGYVDDVYGYNFHENSPDSIDHHNHGTHTAGTLGAVGNNGLGVAGVIWNVKLMPLKFIDRVSGVVAAIDYSLKMGAKISTNSWGYNQFSSSLMHAIQRTASAGQLFVCAVDNKGKDNSGFTDYPPNFNFPNMINVAAITARGDLDTTSNYGKQTVHLAAPGRRIYSTLPNNQYGYKDGTSTATPLVAGVAALLLSYFPNLSATEMKSIILDSVTTLPVLRDKLVTGGILNAHSAFQVFLISENDFEAVHKMQLVFCKKLNHQFTICSIFSL